MAADANNATLLNPIAFIKSGTNFLTLGGLGLNFPYPNFTLDPGGSLDIGGASPSSRRVLMSDPDRHVLSSFFSNISFFSAAFTYTGPPITLAPARDENGALLGVAKLRITISNNPTTAGPGEGRELGAPVSFPVDVDVYIIPE